MKDAIGQVLPGPRAWVLLAEIASGAGLYALLMGLSGQVRWQGRRPSLVL